MNMQTTADDHEVVAVHTSDKDTSDKVGNSIFQSEGGRNSSSSSSGDKSGGIANSKTTHRRVLPNSLFDQGFDGVSILRF